MEQQRIDVLALVDDSRLGAFQIKTVVICALIALLDGYDLLSMAFVTPTIAAEWGIAPANFGAVLSGSLVGLAVGALAAGPISDRYGRRRVLIGALIVLSLATFATALATDVDELFLYRFLTGLGLGASMPNVIALTAEYAPARHRTLLISLMFCGLPLGAALGGQIASLLIESYGWPAVFYFGAAFPIVLLVLAVWQLPESIKYLVLRGHRPDRVMGIVRKLRPDVHWSAECRIAAAPAVGGAGGPVAGLFTERRAGTTLLLWVVFFFNLFALYLLNSWLPTLLTGLGWSNARALQGASAFQLGGIPGALLLGYLADAHGTRRLLPVVFLAAALVLLATGVSASAAITLSLVMLFFCGIGVIGTQFIINGLASEIYPTHARATGVGWALGVGRLGAIVSPLAAGYFIAREFSPQFLFVIAALAPLVCCLAIIAMGYLPAYRLAETTPPRRRRGH